MCVSEPLYFEEVESIAQTVQRESPDRKLDEREEWTLRNQESLIAEDSDRVMTVIDELAQAATLRP
jgi:hypothetical protein